MRHFIVLLLFKCILAVKLQRIHENHNIEVPALDLEYLTNNDQLAKIAAAVQSLLPIKEVLLKQNSENNAAKEAELIQTKAEMNVLKERLSELEREAVQLNMTAIKLHEEARCCKESFVFINNSLQLQKQNCDLQLASLRTEGNAKYLRLESLIQTQIVQKQSTSETIIAELHKSFAEQSYFIANTIKNQSSYDKEDIKSDASFVHLKKQYEDLNVKKRDLEFALSESVNKLTSMELCCKNLSTTKEEQTSVNQEHNTAVNTLQNIIAGLRKDLSIMSDSRKEIENKIINMQQNFDSGLKEQKTAFEKCEQNSRDLQNKFNELNLKDNTLESQVNNLCRGKNALGIIKLGTGRYYFVDHIRLQWTSAEKFCRNLGLDLVSIETQEENDLIINHLREIGLERGGVFWTSGSDHGSEGSFYWTATGQNMGFTFWHNGQPDNFKRNEHCVELWHLEPAGNIRWNDRICTNPGRFICELNSACI